MLIWTLFRKPDKTNRLTSGKNQISLVNTLFLLINLSLALLKTLLVPIMPMFQFLFWLFFIVIGSSFCNFQNGVLITLQYSLSRLYISYKSWQTS